MNGDILLNAALDIAFFGVFFLTLVDYLRRPDPVRRAAVAVFACVAAILATSVATQLGIVLPRPVTIAAVIALLAHPVATIWLITQVRRLPRLLLPALVAGLVVSVVVLLAFPGARVLGLAVVVGFVGVELLGAALLAREGRHRAGSSQSRLYTAAAATGLFGASILVIGVGPLVAGSENAAAASLIARVIALVAAIGYWAAFAPPRPLRQIGQQAIVYDFVRRLAELPSGTPPARIWEVLVDAARTITGGASAMALGGPGAPGTLGAPGGAPTIVASPDWPRTDGGAPAPIEAVEREAIAAGGRVPSLPIEIDGRSLGELRFRLDRGPLFVDDDLQLLQLLVRRAAQAADREQILAERQSLIDELQRASAAKSDFLAAMSHELRTPLNAIIGFSELLQTPRSPAGHDAATVTGYSGHIHDSGLHLLDLINDVLDLSKVEAGRLELRPARFDLTALVGQTLENMRPLVDRKRLTLELPSTAVEVEADPGRIRQVIYNLASNAVKFTPDGGHVSVSIERREREVRLAVADTGPGIEVGDQERIFEAFRQVGSQDAAQPGTGLGLALTRQLVERHGGRIELESAVGQGSTFTVVLPASPVAPAVAVSVPASPAELRADRILVIEDDPGAAELLRVYIAEAGYPVEIAATGQAGLASALERAPAAVILDILLPEMDGWEVLQRLKRAPSTRDVPVVVVSVVDDAQLGLALGAVDYFVKPVGREALLSSLGRLTFTTKVRTREVTVLVVGERVSSGGGYGELLGQEGFTVRFAPTATEGLRAATDSPPDFIIVELTLPGEAGFDLVAALKADERTAAIPIWASTGGDLSAEEKARLNGQVLGVLERGDGALATLRAWLDRMTHATRAAT